MSVRDDIFDALVEGAVIGALDLDRSGCEYLAAHLVDRCHLDKADEVTVLTTAPAAYDYGYTRQLGVVSVLGVEFRVVAIDRRHSTYQCDRYASGIHVASEVR